jgi:anti-sigma factor RsiW
VTIANEVQVGGLWCGQVLDRLSDYLDGDLEASVRDQVEEHLRGCEGCARFGGEFRATVVALRTHLLRRGAMPARLHERLRVALAGEPGPGGGQG